MIIDHHSVYIRSHFKPQKNWAVFLDRDGVINQESHLVSQPQSFRLIPQVVPAIKKLNQQQIPVIVIHNASVVARGLSTTKTVEAINQKMVKLLNKDNVFVDAVFYCPHHPHAFHQPMMKTCSWRKPKPGMLLTAAKIFKLDLSKSFVIGDSARDILAGQAVKAATILVKTGHAGKDQLYQATADKITPNILTAVNWILNSI